MNTKHTVVVKTDDHVYTVRKLPLSDYAQLIKAIATLMPQLRDVIGRSDNKEQADQAIAEVLPGLVANSLDEVCEILALFTNEKPEQFKDEYLDNISELVVAGFQLNNYSKVVENVKKMTARSNQK